MHSSDWVFSPSQNLLASTRFCRRIRSCFSISEIPKECRLASNFVRAWEYNVASAWFQERIFSASQRCKFFCVFRKMRANCDCDCEFSQSQRNRNRFWKKIAIAAQSQSIFSTRNFSQIANCAQSAIFSHFAICDFLLTAICAQFAIFSQFAICDF